MSSKAEGIVSEIAARVAAIVAGRYSSDLRSVAAELGVLEVDLRKLLDPRARAPSEDVLAELLTRIVQRFGVDPGWLVTGRYDVRSHLAAEDNRGDRSALRDQIRRLLRGPDRSVAIERVPLADVRGSGSGRAAARPARATRKEDERER